MRPTASVLPDRRQRQAGGDTRVCRCAERARKGQPASTGARISAGSTKTGRKHDRGVESDPPGRRRNDCRRQGGSQINNSDGDCGSPHWTISATGSSVRQPDVAVCQTEIRLSTIVGFPCKSFRFFHLGPLLCHLAGTIVGTVPPHDESPVCSVHAVPRRNQFTPAPCRSSIRNPQKERLL